MAFGLTNYRQTITKSLLIEAGDGAASTCKLENPFPCLTLLIYGRYKPDMDGTCCPAYTIRLNVSQFSLSKTNKSVINKWKKYLADQQKAASPFLKIPENQIVSFEVIYSDVDMDAANASGFSILQNYVPNYLLTGQPPKQNQKTRLLIY